MPGKFTRETLPVTGPHGPLRTVGPALTHEGGQGYALDAKSDLLTLAAVNMVSEATFYESAGDRDSRFRDLIWQVTRDDPAWVARFVPFLRGELNMRSASVVVAAEYALCLRDPLSWVDQRGHEVDARAGAPPVRSVIASALQRPDEPGEFVAYWTARTGKRTLPGGVQRGVSDAMARLYSERNAIKYDGTGQPVRLGDVVELAHPTPGVPWQSDLYRYLLDRRHHADAMQVSMERLPMLQANREFLARPPAEQRAAVLADPELLDRVGLTWEILSSSGPMDQAAWEAVIPTMGVMALVRNLRNFDEAGVSATFAAAVIEKITSVEDITRSRMFPYQFLSAYKAVQSLRWGPALETAINLSTANVPALPGRWLILIDTSSSMTHPLSAKSVVRHVDVAALFGFVAAARGTADVFGFAGGDWNRQSSGSQVTFAHPAKAGSSILRNVETFSQRIGEVGHGTEIVAAIRETLRPEHTGVAIFTDGQTFYDWDGDTVSTVIPPRIPAVAVDTSGYAGSAVDVSQPNRWQIGGYSDKLFPMINLLARGESGWPF